MWFDSPGIRALVELALTEDVGTGDHATEATIDGTRHGSALVTAKSRAIFCGGPLFALVLHRVDPGLRIRQRVEEGAAVERGDVVLEVEGRLGSILTGERTALNFLQRLSGIATQTRAFVEAVQPHPTRIADTRKTLPGYRSLDKYAVRMGGGTNHRTALDAGILVKENHTMAAGSVQEAIRRARLVGSHLLKVEVEVETLADLDAALHAGAEVVLLDNMTTAQLREAVARVAGRALTEASGNMTLERVAEVAATGVDLISVGALTHSVTAADFSLRIQPPVQA
jgi:nicotinate-nucleotide pyrophosphorylase (carboxylating)